MTLPVYPVLPGLTYSVVKAPEFNTLIMAAPNAYEVRIAQSINPVWHYELTYEFLHDFPWQTFTTVSELRTLMGFYNWQGGCGGSFLLDDPTDNSVGPALTDALDPNVPLAQLSIVNDGAGNYFSPIQRTLDGNFYEDITDLNGVIEVYANGVLQVEGTDYSIEGPGLALPSGSYMGMYLAWTAFPAAPITAQFNFYFRVRFEEDKQPFEEFFSGYWSSAVKLKTARPTSGTFVPATEDSGGGGGDVSSYASNEIPAGTIDGTNDTFILINSPLPPSTLQLFKDGLLQFQNTGGGGDYTLVGNTITFAIPPLSGVQLESFYYF